MYDTINMRLYADECNGADFLKSLPQRLTSAQVNANTDTGELWLDGRLGNLRVLASRYVMQVRDGSLCKWYLGDNYQTLGKADTRQAIEKLSDTLGLPLERAFVTRLDVAANMIMTQPPAVYLGHLGELRYTHRLAEPTGLYYTQKSKACRLAFYDKVRESKDKGDAVPELYLGRNVLRYEQRYAKRLAQRLNRQEMRAAALYDDALHRELVKRWHDSYKQIHKIHESTINFAMVKTKKDFYKLGTLSLIERAGGTNEMLAQIAEARKTGQIDSKQAYDLRAAVRDACKVDGLLVRECDAVRELDAKIGEAAKLYL